ncbi:RNA-binding protein RO60-like [Styela clava]
MANSAQEDKGVLADNLRPDESTEFKWPVTSNSKVWRFLLNGNTSSMVKHSSILTGINSEEIDKLLFQTIEDGKGIELVNTIYKVFSEGTSVKYEAIVYALTLCTCSENAEVKTKAYGLVNEICDQSSHFLQFVDFHEKICLAKRKTTGWSRSHRNAVQKWYQRKSPLEVAKSITKCPRYNHWTHKDVLRLAHTIPENEGQEVVSSFIVAGLKKTLERYKNESEEKIDEAQKVLQYLEQAMMVRSSQDSLRVIAVFKKLNLSWDFIPCHLHKDPQLWKFLLPFLPLTVIIQNVCRMAKLRLFDAPDPAEVQFFISTAVKVQEVKDSGLHPYHILMYRELYNNAMNDAKRKISWKPHPGIMAGLNKCFLLAIQHNLKPTGKRYFITIDASNSMKAHIANNNHVQCRVAAACMALCIARTEQKVIVKAFSKELTDIKIEETTGLDDIVKCLEETPLGGTDCSRPIIFAKGKKIKTDVFIVFTDKETWCGKTTPREALCQYRKHVKIPAKLIVVALNAEGTTEKVVADPEDRGMLDIFGFSPSIPNIISNFASYNY